MSDSTGPAYTPGGHDFSKGSARYKWQGSDPDDEGGIYGVCACGLVENHAITPTPACPETARTVVSE